MITFINGVHKVVEITLCLSINKKERMKMLRGIIFGVLSIISFSVSAVDGWSVDSYQVKLIDTVQAENFAYLTLENYTNANCSVNRIALTHTSKNKFDNMFSLALSAFHSGAKLRFYFPDVLSCSSTRIQLVK